MYTNDRRVLLVLYAVKISTQFQKIVTRGGDNWVGLASAHPFTHAQLSLALTHL